MPLTSLGLPAGIAADQVLGEVENLAGAINRRMVRHDGLLVFWGCWLVIRRNMNYSACLTQTSSLADVKHYIAYGGILRARRSAG